MPLGQGWIFTTKTRGHEGGRVLVIVAFGLGDFVIHNLDGQTLTSPVDGLKTGVPAIFGCCHSPLMRRVQGVRLEVM